jgi:hypothetical protein
MTVSSSLAASRQSTVVLVDMYRRINKKIGNSVNPDAVKLLMYLQGRGYDVNKLVKETF